MDDAIRIKLRDGEYLVVEPGIYEDGFKEVYIGIERPLCKDGLEWQDLAIVQEDYHFADETLEVIPNHGVYNVMVFADENSDDCTDKFIIRQFDENVGGYVYKAQLS